MFQTRASIQSVQEKEYKEQVRVLMKNSRKISCFFPSIIVVGSDDLIIIVD